MSAAAIAAYLAMHNDRMRPVQRKAAKTLIERRSQRQPDEPKKRPVSARTWKRVHYTLTVAWALMLIPTLLWWSDSILWVAGMSLYANVAGHWAAAQAAEADEHSPDA